VVLVNTDIERLYTLVLSFVSGGEDRLGTVTNVIPVD
jgi:hypothetical protein